MQELHGNQLTLRLEYDFVQGRISPISFCQTFPEVLDGVIAVGRFEVLADQFKSFRVLFHLYSM